jgi:hypothetical protein
MLNKLSLVLCIAILSILLANSMNCSSVAEANPVVTFEMKSERLGELSNFFNKADNNQSASEDAAEQVALLMVRSNASQFLNLAQIESHYFLVIEFLAEDLSAKLFKNLSNPPNNRPWYITCHYPQKKSKLSAWKDGNLLYKAILEYHS